MRAWRIVPLLLFAWLAVGSAAWAEEHWNVAFTSRLTGAGSSAYGSSGVTIVAEGRGTLAVGRDGEARGTGDVSITVTYQLPPNPSVSISALTGSGPYEMRGRREGDDLVISFASRTIPCRGTLAAAGNTSELTTEVDVAALAPPSGAIARRTDGTSTTTRIDASSARMGLEGTTTMTLSGGIGIEPAPSPSPVAYSGNVWTLEVESSCASEVERPEVSLSSRYSEKGHARFTLPVEDGPARGEGPYQLTGRAQILRPQPRTVTFESRGVVILDGTVKDDVLTFTPRLRVESTRVQGEGRVDAGFTPGLSVWTSSEPVSMPLRNGAEVAFPIQVPPQPGVSCTGRFVFRLRGKKVEEWRATVDEWNDIGFGDAPGKALRAGIRVRWRRTVDFTVEDGRYQSGRCATSLVSIKGFSNPPGLYVSRPVATTVIGTGTDIEAERWDQVRHARRFNPKYMTPADAALKAKWESLQAQRTPFAYPDDCSVDGVVEGPTVTLTLSEESGFTAAFHCTLAPAAARSMLHGPDLKAALGNPEVLEYDRYVAARSFRVERRNGWRVSRSFTTTYRGSAGWSESSTGQNAGNRQVIEVRRVR